MRTNLITSAARVRGITGTFNHSNPEDVGPVLRELNAAFGDFRAKNDRRIEELTNTVNQQSAVITALQLGGEPGAGVHPGAGLRSASGRAPVLGGEVAASFRNALRGRPEAAMTTQSDPDGGYTVIPQIDAVLDATLRDLSPLRSLARVVSQPSGTGSWEKVVGRTGSQSAWVGEEDERTETAGPTLGKVVITPQEIYALPELTNAILDDSAFDLNGFLQEDVSGEFSVSEGEAFVSGDGNKKPKGFLSYPVATTADSVRDFGTLQFVVSGNASGFVAPTSTVSPADCLHDLLTALRPVYRRGDGVAWIMNSATANVIRKFKDGQGNYIWTNSLVAGQPDRLLGYPVAIDEGMPDIAADAFPVAFGNWQRGYAIVDKPGLRLIVDRVTKKGWTKMFFYKRVGGGVVDSNAIKLLKISA